MHLISCIILLLTNKASDRCRRTPLSLLRQLQRTRTSQPLRRAQSRGLYPGLSFFQSLKNSAMRSAISLLVEFFPKNVAKFPSG